MKNFHEIMAEKRLVCILRGIPEDMLCDVLDTLYEGGIRAAEITYDTAGIIPEETTARMIESAVKHTEGRMYIGAGTVTRTSQLKATKYAGGQFIISPNTDTHIIEQTKLLDLVSIPGAMTVSEIFNAHNAGADYVKLFPVCCLGPQFVKHVLAPLNNAKLIAVAGVTPENIPEYLDAGCVGFGIGGAIANGKLCAEGRLDVILGNAKKYSELCRVK